MVTVEVPIAAVLLAAKVRVEFPLPGAAIDVGLNVAVTPAGNPEAESATAELKPPLTVVETVVLPELPCATDKLAGETLMAKLGAVAGFTVSATVVVWVTPPPVAVMVTLDVPAVAVLLAVNVRLEFPLPGAAMDAGLKLAVTPAGRPEAERLTAELNPPEPVVETVVLAELPCVMERLVSAVLKAKSGVVPGLKMISNTACNSIPFGATPVWPCRKSNIPTPVTCTGMFAV